MCFDQQSKETCTEQRHKAFHQHSWHPSTFSKLRFFTGHRHLSPEEPCTLSVAAELQGTTKWGRLLQTAQTSCCELQQGGPRHRETSTHPHTHPVVQNREPTTTAAEGGIAVCLTKWHNAHGWKSAEVEVFLSRREDGSSTGQGEPLPWADGALAEPGQGYGQIHGVWEKRARCWVHLAQEGRTHTSAICSVSAGGWGQLLARYRWDSQSWSSNCTPLPGRMLHHLGTAFTRSYTPLSQLLKTWIIVTLLPEEIL